MPAHFDGPGACQITKLKITDQTMDSMTFFVNLELNGPKPNPDNSFDRVKPPDILLFRFFEGFGSVPIRRKADLEVKPAFALDADTNCTVTIDGLKEGTHYQVNLIAITTDKKAKGEFRSEPATAHGATLTQAQWNNLHSGHTPVASKPHKKRG